MQGCWSLTTIGPPLPLPSPHRRKQRCLLVQLDLHLSKADSADGKPVAVAALPGWARAPKMPTPQTRLLQSSAARIAVGMQWAWRAGARVGGRIGCAGAASPGCRPACSCCESIMAEESALSWMEALSIRIFTATCAGRSGSAWAGPALAAAAAPTTQAGMPGCWAAQVHTAAWLPGADWTRGDRAGRWQPVAEIAGSALGRTWGTAASANTEGILYGTRRLHPTRARALLRRSPWCGASGTGTPAQGGEGGQL